MNCCFTKRRWFFFCLMAEKMEGKPPLLYIPKQTLLLHYSTYSSYLHVDADLWHKFAMAEQSGFLHRCAQYISVMLGVLFSALGIIIYVWHLSIKMLLLASCHQQEKQFHAEFILVVSICTHISLRIRGMQGSAIWCSLSYLPFSSLLRLDLDYYHILTLCYIKPMSDKKKKTAFFHVTVVSMFVSPGLISSSVAHYLNQV